MVNSFATGIVTEWDVESGKNIKWKAALGSQSYGNPSIADGRVFVGTNNEGKRNPEIAGDKGIVMCFSAGKGEFLWQAVHDKLTQGRVNDWPEQGICSSPAIEGGVIYYISNRCELVCADVEGFRDGENDGPYKDEKYTSKIDGDFIWVLDMLNEYGVFPHNLATCSPLVVGNLVFVETSNGVERDHIAIPNPRAPSFLAVNKKTGEMVWGSNAPEDRILHGQWSCATYGNAGGVPQVLFPGGDGWLYSFEPEDGDLLWKFDAGSAIVSRPAVVAGALVVAGKHGRVVNLIDTKPDTSESNRVLDTEFISDSEIKSPMFVVGNTVYVGTQGSTIIRINVGANRAGRLDMDEVWCLNTEEDIECN